MHNVYVFGHLPNFLENKARECFLGYYNGKFDVVYLVDKKFIDLKRFNYIDVNVSENTIKAYIFIG